MADEEYGGDEQPQEYEVPAEDGGDAYDAPAEEAPAEQYEAPAVPEPEPEPEPEVKQEPAPTYDEQPMGGDFNADTSDVRAYCDNLYSDLPSFNFFVCKLADPKLKKPDLEIEKTGKGGLPELTAYLKTQDTEIKFFELRVNTYDDSQSVRAKFIYGKFMGTKVKFMQKAKLTPNLGVIAENFQVKHLSKDLDENMQDFNPEKLSKEFLKIGGAHKPSRYDYGGGAVYEV